MTDIKAMIARRERQMRRAKKNTISSALEGGLKEFLIDWLLEHQRCLEKINGSTNITMHLLTATDRIRDVIDMVDMHADIEVIWAGEPETVEALKLDGIRIKWSSDVSDKRGEDQLQVDSSTLLLREIGIE